MFIFGGGCSAKFVSSGTLKIKGGDSDGQSDRGTEKCAY